MCGQTQVFISEVDVRTSVTVSHQSMLQLCILSEWKTLPHKFPCFTLILPQQCSGLIVKDLKWHIVKLNCPTLYRTCTKTGFSFDCNNIRVSPYFQCLARTGIYCTSSRKYCKYLSLHEAIPLRLTGRWGWHHTVAKLWWWLAFMSGVQRLNTCQLTSSCSCSAWWVWSNFTTHQVDIKRLGEKKMKSGQTLWLVMVM